MANYSLVINSKFQPFSFERYIQPYQIYGQAYREQEDALSELATKASIWDKMTNAETDKKAHAMYEAYARDLEEQASQLSKHGLNPSSRQQMLKMRSRYSSDIVPIEQAYKRREEQAKQQAEIMAKDPTHFFARTASTTSLDDYIANPSLDTISQNYSGALLTQQVSQAAAALAKDARNDPNVRTELRKLLPYQYETIRRTGFDPETVMQAILNSPDANKILTGIVDTAMANSGMNDWNYMSPEDKQRILTQARQYANQGLWSAVGQTQYGSVTDQYGMNVAMENLRHQHAKELAELQNNNRGLPIIPVPLRSAQEMSNKNKQIQEFISKGYFVKTPNGGYKLTKDGEKEYLKKYGNNLAKLAAGEASSSEEYKIANSMSTSSPLKQFLDEANGGKAIIENGKYVNGVTGPGTVGNLFNKVVNSYKEGSYDTYHSTEYRYQLGSTDEQNRFTEAMWTASPRGFHEVDFDGKKRAFTHVGSKPLSQKDLEGYRVVEIRPHNNSKGQADDTVIWMDKDNNVKRTTMPSSINMWANENIRRAISDADIFGRASAGKYAPMIDNNRNFVFGVNGELMYTTDLMTDDDRIALRDNQYRALQSMMHNVGSINPTYVTKETSLTPLTPSW